MTTGASSRLPRLVLLPNVVGFPSVSMEVFRQRYTESLTSRLAGEWEIQELRCDGAAPWQSVLPGKVRDRLRGLHARWNAYPKLASSTEGDVYHILDHSHATLAESLPGSKTVLTCHDIIPLLASRGLLDVPVTPWGRRTFLRRLDAMRRCARIVAVSECTRRDLIGHAGFDPAQIVVIPNGLDTSFRPEPPGSESRVEEAIRLRREWGIPSEARVVLHVGTRNRYKNTTGVIRAMARLRSTRDDVWLVRIGAPLFDDDATLLETSGLGDRFVHAGRVSDATLRSAYRSADVFVFPSLYEGFGWPPAEAMASGTPVVVSNAGSLPEVVGAAAPTVEPADFEALAGEVALLLDDRDLHADRVRAGLAQVARFRWENTVDAYRAVYSEIAGVGKITASNV